MKRIVTFLLICLPCLGQPTPTITTYEPLATDIEVLPTVTQPVGNVGQTGHLFIAILEDNPPNVCDFAAAQVPAPTILMEGSFDDVVYVNLANSMVMSESGVKGAGTAVPFVFVAGKSPFPYVRLNITAFNNVDCQMDVYYAGGQFDGSVTNSIYRFEAAGPPDNRSNTAIGFWFSWDSNAAIMAGAPHVFDGATWDRLLDSETSVPIIAGAAATTEIVALTAGQSIYVQSFSLTLAAGGTAQWVTGTGAACAVGQTNITGAYSLAGQGNPLVVGTNIGRLFVVPEAQALCLTTTGAGATAAGLLTYAQY